jgi:hypothetical protein
MNPSPYTAPPQSGLHEHLHELSLPFVKHLSMFSKSTLILTLPDGFFVELFFVIFFFAGMNMTSNKKK